MIQNRVCRISLHCQALSIEGPDVKPGWVEPNVPACSLARLGINSVTLLYAEYCSDSCSCPALGHAVGSLYTSYFLATTTTFPVELPPGAPYLMVPAGRALCTQSAEAEAANTSVLSNRVPEGLCGTKSLFPFLLRNVTEVQCREGREPTTLG